MVKFNFGNNGFGEVLKRVLSIATISVGGWFFYDKIRTWLSTVPQFEKYWWLIALGLLYIGLVIIDLE